jgi:hypothetical protein
VLIDLTEERGDEVCALDDGFYAGHKGSCGKADASAWRWALPGRRAPRLPALAQDGSAATPGVAPPTAQTGWNSSFDPGTSIL